MTNHTQISGNSGSSFLIKITKPLGPSLDRMVMLDFLFGMIEQSTYIPAETYLILKIPAEIHTKNSNKSPKTCNLREQA